MTGSAGGRDVIVLAGDPLGGIEIHLIHIGVVADPVFGLLVDLFLRMIRAQVAFAAGLRLTGLFRGETVPLVTGRAGTLGAVRVETADAGVGPGGRVQLAVRIDLHRGTVALPTTLDGGRGFAVDPHLALEALDHFRQHVIE